MSLKGLLATSLSPNQEDSIAYNAEHILSLLISNPSILDCDEQTQQKLRVRISAFLKSKSPISRWFGCFLCKIVLQSPACWQMIKSHGQSWAGSIQHLLEIPEPIATHQIAIQCLSTLFSRTYGKANMTREITTPRLNDYLKQLLRLAEKETQLWTVIVPALKVVLRQQSTTFRPFVGRVEHFLLGILNQAMREPVDSDILRDVFETYVSLHMAAPKEKEAEQWKHAIHGVMADIHSALSDMAGEFVHEEQSSVPRYNGSGSLISSSSSQYSPINRLKVLIDLLQSFFTTGTKVQVKLPFGAIIQLADRMYSLPFCSERQGVERDQRQFFFLSIEQINIQITNVLINISDLIGTAFIAHHEMLLHHAVVTATRSTNTVLKLRLIELITVLLEKVSLAPVSFNENMTTLVSVSMKMLEPVRPPNTSAIPDFVTRPEAFDDKPHSSVFKTVGRFFQTLVVAAPALPLPTRSAIDRYFILSRNTRGSARSAMYPGSIAKYSTLPMALRLSSKSEAGDSLVQAIHPRFPPLAVGSHSLAKSAVLSGDSLESEDDNDEYDHKMMVDTSSVAENHESNSTNTTNTTTITSTTTAMNTTGGVLSKNESQEEKKSDGLSAVGGDITRAAPSLDEAVPASAVEVTTTRTISESMEITAENEQTVEESFPQAPPTDLFSAANTRDSDDRKQVNEVNAEIVEDDESDIELPSIVMDSDSD